MIQESSMAFDKNHEAYDIKESRRQFKIVLAGNPNVGKSTVFNELTGMKQHTGNWAGKTVAGAVGIHKYGGDVYKLTDTPGIYSLSCENAEEKAARDQIYSGEYDGIIVVCDATHMERNLGLVLQCMEVTRNIVLCINLIDEAEKNNITIDTDKLSCILGIEVCAVCARNRQGLDELMHKARLTIGSGAKNKVYSVEYTEKIETAISLLIDVVKICILSNSVSARLVCLKLLCEDYDFIKDMQIQMEINKGGGKKLDEALQNAKDYLKYASISAEDIKEEAAKSLVQAASHIADKCIKNNGSTDSGKYDRILTGKYSGGLLMAVLLFVVLWITVYGANYPSSLLMNFLFGLEDGIYSALMYIGLPALAADMLVFGVYRVLAWVIAVMLPPMAIFFPMFTVMEDAGYLPRVAFNLDKYFNKCKACGKQALTMCMGFGCNAVGVTGCRIIDSKREKLIAIITNSFVPCNGRFPILLAIITMYFASGAGALAALESACILTFVMLIGVAMTFGVSWVLSRTILAGEPSAFLIEMPSIRRPQVGKVIVRSVFDRTLFVLARAVVVAAPAGLFIWVLANLQLGGMPALKYMALFLEPLGQLMGMDGVILLAFILGFPANEIVMPIMIMIYTATGTISEAGNPASLKLLLEANGWTMVTVCSTLLFTLFHWPCSTTMLTIKKETASNKWTFISFVVPMACGVILCILLKTFMGLMGIK